MGRLAPCLHPFWVTRPLLGCLRAPRTLESTPEPPPPSHPQSVTKPPLQSWLPSRGCPLLGVQQVPPLLAPALKRGPVIRPSPPPPWDALKDFTSDSDTASLFISNPFFPAWKLLTSLPGQENPHSGRTTSRYFQTLIWMAISELIS